MSLRRALCIAAVLLPAAAGPAAAQVPPGQQAPPCYKKFSELRDDAAHKANAIRIANQKKVGPKRACHLFNVFSAAEAKLVKYATDNAAWCGIPERFIKNMKEAHAKTTAIRSKICRVAAAPPRPRGPSLSDALSAPVPDASNIRQGGGTFDTLTGTPLGAR